MKLQFRLILLTLCLMGSLLLIENSKTSAPKEYEAQMLAASRQTQAAFLAIKEEKLQRGYVLSPVDDPNLTGMVGEPFTEITTTLGNLEAKRSTTNPNVAAVIVDMFYQLDLQPGDQVAVNLSSSFPCLNIAVLCAMDVMGLEGTVINSVGASTYGANLPDFTYLDMEHLLVSKGLLTNHTTYFSLGGQKDMGKEMPEQTKEAIISRLSGLGYELLSDPDLTTNLETRLALYQQDGTPSCFVNVGGNLLAFGGGEEMTTSDNGIIRQSASGKGQIGLVPMFLDRQVPSIHLLNMKSLLPAYGLPIDPVPLPQPGQGGVYQKETYNKALLWPLFLVNTGLLLWVCKAKEKKSMPL